MPESPGTYDARVKRGRLMTIASSLAPGTANPVMRTAPVVPGIASAEIGRGATTNIATIEAATNGRTTALVLGGRSGSIDDLKSKRSNNRGCHIKHQIGGGA